MPYITTKERQQVCEDTTPRTVGELNFLITQLIIEFLSRQARYPNYEQYNAMVGVLECVKMELYRRMISKYEDKKKKENGDVYPSVPSWPDEGVPPVQLPDVQEDSIHTSEGGV